MKARRTHIIIGLVVLAALGYYFLLRSKPLGPMGEVVSTRRNLSDCSDRRIGTVDGRCQSSDHGFEAAAGQSCPA